MIPRPGHRLAQRIRASGVRGADKPGQLRPRGGRTPWRARGAGASAAGSWSPPPPPRRWQVPAASPRRDSRPGPAEPGGGIHFRVPAPPAGALRGGGRAVASWLAGGGS